MTKQAAAQVRTEKLRVFTAAVKTANDSYPDYKNAICTLMTYAAQVKAYTIADISQKENWPGGEKAYLEAEATWATTTNDLAAWSAGVYDSLVTIPSFLMYESNVLVVPKLNEAISDAAFLVNSPGDLVVQQDLMGNLRFLQHKFSVYDEMLDNLISLLESGKPKLDEDAATMTTLATDARNTEGVDNAQIDQLKQDMKNLRQDIKEQIMIIVSGSLVGVVGLGMGITAIALTWATGGISLFLLLPAVVICLGSVKIIITAVKNLEEDKIALKRDSDKTDALTADAYALEDMADQLSSFVSQVDTMKSAISTIQQPWQATESCLTEFIEEIEAMEDPQSDDWAAVESGLETILTGWNDVIATMKELEMVYPMYPTANLEVGMTEEQVREALEASTPISLAKYLVSPSVVPLAKAA